MIMMIIYYQLVFTHIFHKRFKDRTGWLLAAGREDDEEGFRGCPTRSTLRRGRRISDTSQAEAPT